MNVKFGIDFGTTNSSIAYHYVQNNGKEEAVVFTLKDEHPQETIPSVFCITDRKVYVEDAEYEYHCNSNSGILIKRVKLDLEKEGKDPQYTVGSRTYLGSDLIAALLEKMRKEAEFQKKRSVAVDGVVMGVPVHFGDKEKEILKEALVKAGYYKDGDEANLKTEFVSEPVAAAVFYGLKVTDNTTAFIFDFGGGTLDVAIVNLSKQVNADRLHPHEVIAKQRITLGGEELTKLFFINYFCGKDGYGTAKLCRCFGFRANLTPEELWKNLEKDEKGHLFIKEIERCKCELSEEKEYTFSFISGYRDLPERTVYRNQFEKAIKEPIDRTKKLILDTLKAAHMEPQDINKVLAVGGSSLIPCVRECLKDIFGQKKVMDRPKKEVLTGIVRGLAIVGCREKRIIDDVVDNDYGLWLPHDREFCPIIKRGMAMKEAAEFDETYQLGAYEEIQCFDKDAGSIILHVHRRNEEKEEEITSIRINDAGERKYKVFMHIDPKQETLMVDVYDINQRRWFKIDRGQNEINLKYKQYSEKTNVKNGKE